MDVMAVVSSKRPNTWGKPPKETHAWTVSTGVLGQREMESGRKLN